MKIIISGSPEINTAFCKIQPNIFAIFTNFGSGYCCVNINRKKKNEALEELTGGFVMDDSLNAMQYAMLLLLANTKGLLCVKVNFYENQVV